MPTPREFVFVGIEMLTEFRREWSAIDRRFPQLSMPPDGVPLHEHWETLAMLRQVARDELRAAIRQAARESSTEGFNAVYAIPV
jgi:hypothetical protein